MLMFICESRPDVFWHQAFVLVIGKSLKHNAYLIAENFIIGYNLFTQNKILNLLF